MFNIRYINICNIIINVKIEKNVELYINIYILKMDNATGLVIFKDKNHNIRVVLVILNERRWPLKVGTPGGVKDRSDKNLFSTFKREYREEVGQELQKLVSVRGSVPYMDDYSSKTRIYYSHLENPSDRIRYDITKVLHSRTKQETIGIIFPKLEHIRDVIYKTPKDHPVFINTGGAQYYLRSCAAKSLRKMFDNGLLSDYLR
jgi:8-oxo-dGTP pyrophosphatase MutT (NUDIX family)